jgi:hypothetical protein
LPEAPVRDWLDLTSSRSNTFRKVLQRTLACKARFERLLCLFRSTPMMVMCTSRNRGHISCVASASSFESEGQRHVAVSSYIRLGLQLQKLSIVPRNLGMGKMNHAFSGVYWGKPRLSLPLSSHSAPTPDSVCARCGLAVSHILQSSRTSDRAARLQFYHIITGSFGCHAAPAKTKHSWIC